MPVIIGSLGEILGGRGMQNWAALFFRTPEITHFRQWPTQLIDVTEFVSLNNG